jgi:hypothetical protein
MLQHVLSNLSTARPVTANTLLCPIVLRRVDTFQSLGQELLHVPLAVLVGIELGGSIEGRPLRLVLEEAHGMDVLSGEQTSQHIILITGSVATVAR